MQDKKYFQNLTEKITQRRRIVAFDPSLSYCGRWRLEDPFPGGSMTLGSALLSSTRTYAPRIALLSKELTDEIKSSVHSAGGEQTK